MKYARIINSIVQETFFQPSGFTLDECFTPEIAKTFEQCPDTVEAGHIKNSDGTFSIPIKESIQKITI